jgi:hypothetical protein
MRGGDMKKALYCSYECATAAAKAGVEPPDSFEDENWVCAWCGKDILDDWVYRVKKTAIA